MARERLLLIRTSPRLFILGWPIKGRTLFRIVATLSPAGKRREAHSLSVLAERSSGLANGYDSAFKREGERVESLSFSFPRGTISVRPYRCFPDTGRTMEKEGEGERERERATPHEQRHAVQCNARSGQRETQPMQRATRPNVGTLMWKRERERERERAIYPGWKPIDAGRISMPGFVCKLEVHREANGRLRFRSRSENNLYGDREWATD